MSDVKDSEKESLKEEKYKVSKYDHGNSNVWDACGVDDKRFLKFTNLMIKMLLKDGKTSEKAETIENLIVKHPDVYPRFVAVLLSRLARMEDIQKVLSGILMGDIMEKSMEEFSKTFAKHMVQVMDTSDPEEISDMLNVPIELAREIIEKVKQNGGNATVLRPSKIADNGETLENFNINEESSMENTMKNEEELATLSSKVKH